MPITPIHSDRFSSSSTSASRSPGARRLWIGLAVGWLLICVAALSGCSDMVLPAGDAAHEEAADEDFIQQAERQLKSHRVDRAHDIYRQALDERPDNGNAAAGVAVTRLLLIFEMDEVTELLIEHLDASGGIDANEFLFAEQGYLYLASRGMRWTDDDDEYPGIRELVDDDLPWDSQRLESIAHFVDGLDEPATNGFRQWVSIANGLSGIDSYLKMALDDPEFVRLYIPGEVFHDSSLPLRLGRSELALARAAISLVRSVIYFVTAYEHDWTLETAFGHWRHDPPTDHERYTPGHQAIDYTVDYLDEHLFRGIDSSGQLAASKTQLRQTIEYLRDTLRYGVEQPVSTTLEWDHVDESEALEVDEFLVAIGAAIDGPTEIPYVHPQITLDLRPLFDDTGRTLDEDIPWFIRRSDVDSYNSGEEDTVDGLDRWELNDEAVEQFWLQGIVDPVPDDHQFDIEAGTDNDIRAFKDALFSPYWSNVEDIYFTTR